MSTVLILRPIPIGSGSVVDLNVEGERPLLFLIQVQLKVGCNLCQILTKRFELSVATFAP